MRALLHELRAQHARNYGWALACCGWRREQAEDVLQESYLRVLDGRAKFAGQSSAGTWFFAVIKRVAAESFRRQKRRELLNLRILQADTRPAETSEDADSAQQLQRDESTAALTAALLELPQRQREVLHLVFYSELTLEQAAQVLQISLGSVRTHYHRAKTALAVRLELEEQHDTLG